MSSLSESLTPFLGGVAVGAGLAIVFASASGTAAAEPTASVPKAACSAASVCARARARMARMARMARAGVCHDQPDHCEVADACDFQVEVHSGMPFFAGLELSGWAVAVALTGGGG